MLFQSPSRWGRSCIIVAGTLPLDSMTGVSVPFSMGMVLHRRQSSECADARRCFSPLLDGDGVASIGCTDVLTVYRFSVSVPFSMGMVLHRRRRLSLNRHGVASLGFSPLLDGDGLASLISCDARHSADCSVSVPFSIGDGLASVASSCEVGRIATAHAFQSPSRWGWSCIGQLAQC